MAMDNDDVISVLNNLIETSEDGIKGFHECADHIRNAEAKAFFTDRVRLIERGKVELQNEVRRLGGDPEHRGTAGGAMHRAWVKVKSAVTGKDDEAILAEAVRGEEVAVENYEDALGKDLPPEIRTIIDRQYRGVVENRDRVKRMKDSRSATRSAATRDPDREAPPPM